MAIHSFIEPHEYNLRRATKALLARVVRRERQFKIFFYIDELPEPGDFLRSVVGQLGGACQREGRHLIARGRSSWRDISSDRSMGLAPSSGTLIICQGKPGFVNMVARILQEEKERRRQPGKRRTGLVDGIGGGMWQR